MDLSRLKKAIAGASVAALTLTQVGTVLAAYNDVPAGVWYEDAVMSFVDAGYLDDTQPRFRGSEPANRAEFVKLVVELNGGILSTPPAVPSFDDVATGAWYYGYMEEAGKEGWVRGDGDCYGSSPCYARPGANINRAEAAALIVRSFGLEWTGDASQFVDNPSGQWYTDVIQTAADHCVLQGDDSTGRVRPGDNMNRAEMVVMLHRVDQGLVYGVDCGDDGMGAEPLMTDVVATSATTIEVEFNHALDADTAEDAGAYAITGAGDIAVNSAELIDTDLVLLTLGEALEANGAYTLSIIDLMTEGGIEFSDALGFSGYSPIITGDGILEVSLAASNPVSDTVPKGSVGVVMLSADFTSSCDDSVIIEDITVLHEGFGDEADIDGVYVAIDGARVTRKRTIDSEDQTADMRFSSPLVIDPCETVTVDIIADFASNIPNSTSAEHNLVIELASDVVSNALDVSGNFPLRGNTFRIAAVSSGIVTVEYRSISPNEVEVGDTGVVVGKFEVSADSVEDQTFYSMTLEQNSSASDGDFTNIAIRRTDGTVLTNTVSSSVGDFVTLVFDPPFTVLEGDKITLEVIADIVGGAGDSISMEFEENSDLFSVGSLYGYGVNGQLYGSQVAISSTPAADSVNIDAGEFTIGIDGPPTQDYTRDDNDAVLANIEFETGGEKIDVKNMYMAVQAQSVTGQILGAAGTGCEAACGVAGSDDQIQEVLEDVEIRNTVTGRTIDGVRLTQSNASGQCQPGATTCTAKGTFQVYRFDDFIVHGDEIWEFRVDYIDNGAGNHPSNGDQFKVHICGEPTDILVNGSLTDNTTECDFGGLFTSGGIAGFQMEVEGLSTGDKVGDVRPRGNVAGNFHRIANATLTIAVKSLNSTDVSVENADDINLLRFEARAGEAEDILFTKSVFESGTGATSLQNIQDYALWVDTDNDGVVDTILEDGVATQDNEVSFTDLAGGGFVIPAEETVVFEVHGSVASSLKTDDFQLAFATGTSNYLEAEELDDGSNLSGIETNGSCTPGNCDVIVSTLASTLWSLVNSGDLFVTKDTTPLRSRQLLGGALGEEVLRLEFHAENEDIDVTDLQITSSGSTASSIDRLELYLGGAAEAFAWATVGGCGNDDVLTTNPQGTGSVQTFCANMESRQLVIPEGQDVDILIRPRMKSDKSGGTGGQLIQLFIGSEAVSSEATGSGAVRARGDQSSNNLIANDGLTARNGEIFIGRDTPQNTNLQIVGNRNVSVLAKITSITNANPDPDNTNIPTGITPFGQFKVAAAAHANSNNGSNDVILSGVVFNVTATNITMSVAGFDFYNKANSSTQTDCDVYADYAGGPVLLTAPSVASGSLLVQCQYLNTSAVNTEIDQGSDATFVLEGNIINSQVVASAASTLQASLQDFDSITNNATFGVSGDSHILWLDSDNAITTSFTWVEYPETTVKSTSYKS